MSNIKWAVEGNSDVLKLGKERLVELITQCDDTFYALILTDTYAISYKHWGKDVYTITCKGITVATFFHKNNHSAGSIQFADSEMFQYSFQSQRGLAIYYDYINDDAIVYKSNKMDGQEELSIRIGETMIDLPIERLLLLITLGKILYKFMKQQNNATDKTMLGSNILETVPSLSHLS